MKARTWLLFFASLGACNTDTFDSGDGGDASSDSRDEIPPVGGGDGSITDAKKDVVTVIPRFCDNIDAAFCADFDIPNDAGAGFTPPNVASPYAAFFVASAVPKNKPMSFEVDIPADASGGFANIEALPAKFAATAMVVDLDINLPHFTTATPAIFAFAFGVPSPDSARYGIAWVGSEWVLTNGFSGTGYFATQPATGTWVHAQLVITLTVPGNVVAVVDGQTTTIPVTDTTGTDSGAGSYPVRLGLGVVRQNTQPPAAPQTVLYDNVVVTLK